MKNIILGILLALILGFITYKIANILCQIEVKCKNCTQTSKNKENSKRNGFFVSEYKQYKTEFKLKNHSENVDITDIWVEKQWFYNSDFCLCKKVQTKDGFNLIVDFKKSNSGTFLFGLTPIVNNQLDKNNGGIEENRKTMRFNNFPTELKLLITEKNPDKNIGWKKSIVSDTIIIKLIE